LRRLLLQAIRCQLHCVRQLASADEAYKQMLLQARAADIIHTLAISGIAANFMQKSLENAGYDSELLKKGQVKGLVSRTQNVD